MNPTDQDARNEHSRESDTQPMRDLHHRLDRIDSHIDSATSELKDLTRRVTSLEAEVAAGPTFPLWAKGMVLTLLLQTFGAVWWAARVDARVGNMPQLEERLTSAFQAMRNSDSTIASINNEHVRMRQELDGIHKRTIEGTDDRWRKRDDEARMAELHRYLDATFGAVSTRIDRLEERAKERDVWWQRIWESGVLRGKKP